MLIPKNNKNNNDIYTSTIYYNAHYRHDSPRLGPLSGISSYTPLCMLPRTVCLQLSMVRCHTANGRGGKAGVDVDGLASSFTVSSGSTEVFIRLVPVHTSPIHGKYHSRSL